MAAPQITVVFDPALPGDSGAVFDAKNFVFIENMNPWAAEANVLASFVDDRAAAAEAAVLLGDITPNPSFASHLLGLNAAGDALEYKSLATQALAEAGTNNTDLMTPLRTAQAIDAQRPYVNNMAGVTRLVNTTYTNTSGRDMHVFVTTTYTTANTGVTLQVGGNDLQRFNIGNGLNGLVFSFAGLVPDGHTYGLIVGAGTATINAWRESEY